MHRVQQQMGSDAQYGLSPTVSVHTSSAHHYTGTVCPAQAWHAWSVNAGVAALFRTIIVWELKF